MPKKKTSRRHCFVYIMEMTTNKSLSTVLSGKRVIKIGISNSPKRRQSVIDEDVPGKVVIRDVFKFPTRFTAGKVEKHLHNLFKKQNVKIKAGPRAGVNEWFLLSGRQYRKLTKQLDRFYYSGGLNNPIDLSSLDLDVFFDAIFKLIPLWAYPFISILIAYYLIKMI